MHLQAQFIFSYDGPDTIFVGDDCTGILDWGHPETPTASPTVPGQVIIYFDIFSISDGYMIGDPVPAGEIVTIFYEAQDNMGHFAMFGFSIVFWDSIPPEFDPATLPADMTVECSIEDPPMNIGYTDNCASDTTPVTLTFMETGSSNLCDGGVIERTWTLEDFFGNTTSYTQNITANPDTVAPIIDGFPSDGSGPCENAPALYADWIAEQRSTFSAFDEGCGVMELFDNAPEPDFLENFCGEVPVDFFAVDSCSNTISVTATFTVTNSTAPVITLDASDSMADCSGGDPQADFAAWINSQGGAMAEDDCSAVIWLTNPPDPSLADACNDEIEIEFIATDGCGNSASTFAAFFVQDTTPPVITAVAQNRVLACSSANYPDELNLWLSNAANSEASDLCTLDDEMTVQFFLNGIPIDSAGVVAAFEDSILTGCTDEVIVGGILYNNMLALITLEFGHTDACGNMTTTTASFGVTDGGAPVFETQPLDTIVNCIGGISLQDIFDDWYTTAGYADVTDDCGSVIITGSPDQATAWTMFQQDLDTACMTGASVSVAFTAEDYCGNSTQALAEATFSVVDSVAPEIETPATNLALDCDPDLQGTLQAWLDTLGGAEATDNCNEIIWTFTWVDLAGDTLSGNPETGPYPDVMSFGCNIDLDVTFEAADLCGNTVSTNATFSSTDTLAPLFVNAQAQIAVSCEAVPDTADFTVDDNCGAVQVSLAFVDSLAHNPDTSACAEYNYTINRVWTATDACGNSAQFAQQITVSDTIAPQFESVQDITVACGNLDDPEVTGSPGNISDNCDPEPTITYSDAQTGSGCAFSVMRTWYIADACGNVDSTLQMITVEDTLPPVPAQAPTDFILACDTTDTDAISIAFDAWVGSGGFANFEDNCGAVHYFVAEPGSYSIDDPDSYPGQMVSLPALGNCSSAQNGIFLEVFADVVYYDDCGNADATTIRFAVEDEQPPIFLNCENEQVIAVNTDDCEAAFSVFPPLVDEGCLAEFNPVEIMVTEELASTQPGNPDVPVLSFVLNFNPVPLPPQIPVKPIILRVRLDNVDADGAGEYFNIYGENGEFIGRTPILDSECGSGSIEFPLEPEQLYPWITDGQIFFSFEPNVNPGSPGNLSINDICPEASVTGTLEYQSQESPNLAYSYSLNGDTPVDINQFKAIDFLLPPGEHTLAFFVTDCSGNVSTCQTTYLVQDLTPPTLECPDDIAVATDPESCTATISIPEPRVVGDNCGLVGDYNMTFPIIVEESFLTFSFDEEIAGWLADDVIIEFSGVSDDATGDAILELDFRGDVDEAEEYFTVILDEIELGTTEVGQSNVEVTSCDSVSTARFGLAKDNFNILAADGNLILDLRVFRDFMSPPDGPDSGINPCDPDIVTMDGDIDEISYMRATLRYPRAKPQVYATGATILPLTSFPGNGDPLNVPFNTGESTLYYVLNDVAGNSDTCQIAVEVTDTEFPRAVCQPGILYVHPSGTIPGEITFDLIDGGTSDNCGIDSVNIFPSEFPCDSAGTTQDVTMIVMDASGNADTCETEVRIEVQILEPTYEVGICENDSLKLFANVPPVPGNPYTFFWSGPGAFVSNQENPVIPNVSSSASGTYILEVTGVNGCMSSGTVEVFVDDLNAPSLEANRDSICIGESVVLNATDYTVPVEYMWYRGTAPNGLLLQPLTTNPTFTVTPPAAGTYSYYVIVESAACTSNPSENVIITVFDKPVAEVDEPILELCEGESILLGAVSGGPNMTYQWSGPNGFSSNMQNPPAIPNATPENAGFYELIVFVGECASDPVYVEVLVKPKPETPMISGDTAICEGETLVLMVNNVDDADQYIWLHPNGSSIPTAGNTLVIEDIGHDDEGGWTVEAVLEGCRSNLSPEFFVDIDSALIISIAPVPDVCEGEMITLQAPIIPGAGYLWSGPGAFSSTDPNPELVPESGTYSLTVTSAEGCTSTATTIVETVDPVIITAISNDAGNCANGVDSVHFFVTLNTQDDGSFTYQWTGPNGFTSSLPEPAIDSLNAGLNGYYTLIVFRGNCPSEPYTDSIQVTNAPAQPIITGEDTVCTGDDLILEVAGYTGGNILYAWDTPGGNIDLTNDSILVIPSANPDLSGGYTLQVEINGCPSPVSDTFQVEVIPELAIPLVQAPPQVCEGDSLVLSTPTVPGATYAWSGPSNFTSSLQNPVIYPAMTTNSGLYQVVVSIKNCSSGPADPVLVDVIPLPAAPAIAPFDGSACLDDPSPVEICIDSASVQPGASYFWFNGLDGSFLGTSGSSLCFTLEDFSGFVAGENPILVQAEVNGCRSPDSEALLLPMYNFPEEMADAGPDQTLCLDDELFMMANEPIFSTGSWQTVLGGGTFSDSAAHDATVTSLGTGENLFVWSLSFESCINFSSDTVLVETELTPNLEPDTVVVPFGQTVNFNTIGNDLVPDGFTATIATNPLKGNSLSQGGGNFVYTPNIGYVGEDMMVYRICNDLCPDQCDEAVVIFKVGDEDDCFVPTLFTPNSDGVNDLLIIPCLETERYPNNRVLVFNEWGDRVFEAQPYDNTWDGKYNGEDLPVATYFILVDFGDGTPVRKGFLILDR